MYANQRAQLVSTLAIWKTVVHRVWWQYQSEYVST